MSAGRGSLSRVQVRVVGGKPEELQVRVNMGDCAKKGVSILRTGRPSR